jgi:hypothetical protein
MPRRRGLNDIHGDEVGNNYVDFAVSWGWLKSCCWYICWLRSPSAFLVPAAFQWGADCWWTARKTDGAVSWSLGATASVSDNNASASGARVRDEYQSLAGHIHDTLVSGIADCGSFVGKGLN